MKPAFKPLVFTRPTMESRSQVSSTMKIQFDRKRFLALTVSFITIFLFGCSPAILVELRNDGRETIHVRDAIKGLVSISPGQTALLDSGLRLSIEGPSKRAYELRKVPSKYVQTEKLGYVI